MAEVSGQCRTCLGTLWNSTILRCLCSDVIFLSFHKPEPQPPSNTSDYPPKDRLNKWERRPVRVSLMISLQNLTSPYTLIAAGHFCSNTHSLAFGIFIFTVGAWSCDGCVCVCGYFSTARYLLEPPPPIRSHTYLNGSRMAVKRWKSAGSWVTGSLMFAVGKDTRPSSVI